MSYRIYCSKNLPEKDDVTGESFHKNFEEKSHAIAIAIEAMSDGEKYPPVQVIDNETEEVVWDSSKEEFEGDEEPVIRQINCELCGFTAPEYNSKKFRVFEALTEGLPVPRHNVRVVCNRCEKELQESGDKESFTQSKDYAEVDWATVMSLML